ncbi:LCP family protein [Nonomuraea sp. NPDC050691]|uniref:LCP family protein n=1 Tax=Nonomuraea sp. NPDC050691 TaxID=3155661 RepID=UPI0033CCB218
MNAPGGDDHPSGGRGGNAGPGAPGGKGGPGGKGPGGKGSRGPGRPGGAAPRFARPLNAGSILGWTALSAIVPGVAHLRAGHRRTGLALIGVYAVLLLAALAYYLVNGLEGFTGLADTDAMLTVVVVASLGALSWFALMVTSYVALRPNRLNQQGQILSGILVGVLCVAVMAPFALTASSVLEFKNTVHAIFPSAPDDPGIAPIKTADPWNGANRVNFLLIGGDAAGNRTGVRTDSMTVASIDIRTGNTVLFSLPRNLQHVRFPPTSPLHKQFPHGFMAELPNGGLLNEVWQYANDNPQLMGGRNKGPRALMDAIGHTLNLKIDYYMLMNMFGFADLVDAIGGLKIRVEQDVKWGGHFGTAGTIKAGYRRLTGEQALWYGRSRVNSDDFSRMGRQRCVIGAFAKQATPAKILTNFSKIMAGAKRLAQTNIPEPLLKPLVDLALKVKNAKITSMQFVPPDFWPGSADWVKIRRFAAKALSDSVKPRSAQAANVSASPGTPTAGSPTSSSPVTAARPTQTPTRNGSQKTAKTLEELCGL